MLLTNIVNGVHIGTLWDQVFNWINKFVIKRCLPIIYNACTYDISKLCISILLHMPLSSRNNAIHYFYNDKVAIIDNEIVSYP